MSRIRSEPGRRSRAAVGQAIPQAQRELSEALPHIVWTARPDGAVDYISADFNTITGLGEIDLLAGEWLQAVHPDDRGRAMDVWRASVVGACDYAIEFRLRDTARNDYRWYLVAARPHRSAGGKVLKWYGSAIDIHDRKLAESALIDANRRNEAILGTVSEGVHGLDAQGRIMFENPAAAALLGYPPGELIGLIAYDVLVQNGNDDAGYGVHGWPVYQTLRDGKTRSMENERFFRRDGSSFPVAYTCSAVPAMSADTGLGVVLSFRDLSGASVRRP